MLKRASVKNKSKTKKQKISKDKTKQENNVEFHRTYLTYKTIIQTLIDFFSSLRKEPFCIFLGLQDKFSLKFQTLFQFLNLKKKIF